MSKPANMLAALVALSSLSVARAQTKLTVAIYAPNAPFGSGQDRYSFIQRLATAAPPERRRKPQAPQPTAAYSRPRQ